MSQKKVLITGGCGFVGANFVHHWVQHYPNDFLVVLDKLTYAADPESLVDLESHVKLVVGDICEAQLVDQLFSEFDFELVVHFAAESHVDRSINSPQEFIQTNILGTYVLLEAARKHWLGETSDVQKPSKKRRFHHVSTDEVFGSLSEEDEPFHEMTSYKPSSPYSASKASSDHLVRSYFQTYSLDVTTTNCSNNYGPRQDLEKLIPKTIQKALNGKKIPLYGQGLNIRDWLFVEDHCRAIDLVIQNAEAGETFCIGGGVELRNIDIVERICQQIDARFLEDPTLNDHFPSCPINQGNPCFSLVEFVEDRKGHDWRYAINDAKLQNQLGPLTVSSFEEALNQTIGYYINTLKRAEPLQ